MPLSGASVVAEALFRAGLFLGDGLRPPSARDAAGFFADEDIVRFHDDLLAQGRANWDDGEALEGLAALAEFDRRAADLLSLKFGGRPAWGWKDPRTTLFLESWSRLLPEARWIFVLRKPQHVVWSLLSRGGLALQAVHPAARARLALRLWTHYNRRVLDFCRAHPGRTSLVLAPDDFEPAASGAVSELLRERWGYDLGPVDLEAAYNPYLLKTRTPRWIGSLARLHRPSRVLFEELASLRAARASPASPHASRAVGARVVCLLARHKFLSSETFIQAHLGRLPARVHLIHGPPVVERPVEGVPGGNWFPTRTKDDLPLRSPLERVADVLLREFHVESTRLRDRAFRRFLRREKVDAVLAEYGPNGVNILEACEREGCPVVVHFHGFDAYTDALLKTYREGYARLFASAAAIVAVSHDMERQLLDLGAPRARLFYNPCGVDTSLFRGADPAKAPPLFLSVGRFVEKKAPQLTLLAFREVLRACPEARLVMIGDGELREGCQQMAGPLGIAHAASFPGTRSQAEVAAGMRAARGFVQHSMRTSSGNSEGTPVTILEAGAAGLPVVATRHAGIRDVVRDGETGLLVEEGDVEAMAAHMLALARDPELAATLGGRAREHVVANFSMQKSITTLWNIVEGAIKARAALNRRAGSHPRS